MRNRREDRFRYDDRPYDRFAREYDDDRGWFGRVRDTASRWLHGRDEHDDDSFFDEEERRRFLLDEEERARRVYEERVRARERFERAWEDERRDRLREGDDARVRQFASWGRDEDDLSPQFNRSRHPHGTLGRRGDARWRERGPGYYDHADEDDRWMISRDDAWGDDYFFEPRRPNGNVHDQRRAYDREREHYELHRDDRVPPSDRMVDREGNGHHPRRRFDPFEYEDRRREISRFRDRDRRR